MADWEKIRYASFLFKSDAWIWWELMEETHDVAMMTLGDFRRLFEGISSVKEYSIRFNSLARFAPGIMSTPKLRRDKFVHGLNPEIARDVMVGAQPPQTYSEALERALRAKVFVNKLTSSTPSTVVSNIPPPALQRDRFDTPNSREGKNKKRFQSKKNKRDGKNKRPRTIEFPQCQKCGKYHLGECPKGVCFRCRQPGHMMKDCKAPPTPTAQTSRGTNAQVFTVAQSEAEASPLVVTGQLLFHSVSLYALVDSRAPHSFITHGIIERLGLKPITVEQPIKIELPDGDSVVKVEHQRPSGLLQPLSILEWKWEDILMDFITGLLRVQKGYNALWVIVDRLTKSTHFLAVRDSTTSEQLT
ncbi:uncharacterized protein LOC116145055 [Pistacia vera]|uniref:uncharacterized protein LOC116145055 n=1 Tax=Pistacia vera TaxID=55513 RepID=UPI001263272D|nr:uncharacterized protein LOC116145055 [Pistacia vera]